MKKLFSWTILLVLYSCADTKSPEIVIPAEDIQTDNSSASSEQSQEEIESKIAQHEPFFLSYWYGMTEDEVEEVTEYLVDKGDLKQHDNSKGVMFANNISFLIWTGDVGYEGYLDLQASSMYELAITFDYSLGPYNDIVKFYMAKYGEPIEEFYGPGNDRILVTTWSRSEGYIRKVFVNKRTRVSVEYYAKGGMVAVNFIKITYEDQEQCEKNLDMLQKNERSNEELKHQTTEKSFNNI